MDEHERQEQEKKPDRHLRLVSKQPDQVRERPLWIPWVIIGTLVIVLSSVTLMRRVPFPEGDLAQPIGFHPQTSVNIADLEDGLRSVSLALVRSDWSSAARHSRTLRNMWILMLPIEGTQREEASWANSDVALFEAALTRLDDAIRERNLQRAHGEVATLEGVISPYRS